MTTPNDGGPAYPTTIDEGHGWRGLTIRDWFAGQALAATIRNAHGSHGVTYEAVAREVYKVADAMLRARGVDK